MADEKTAPDGTVLAGSEPSEGANSWDHHTRKIDRLSRAKNRALEMVDHLQIIAQSHKKAKAKKSKSGKRRGSRNSKHTRADKTLEVMKDCGEFLLFRHYWTVKEVRLHKMVSCKQFRVCPLCAIRRASKMAQSYLARYEVLRALHPEWKAYFVTLTVKDGEDLLERLEHLQSGHKTLQSRRRDWLKKGWGSSVWNRIHGVVGAYEATLGRNSGLAHPHFHAVILADEMPIEQDARGAWRCPSLEREWEEITGDSKVVDVRPFDAENQTPAKSFCEVFKYALKFSNLPVATNWEWSELLRGKRLTTSYGAFRGVEVPEELEDESLEDLPFIELLYSHIRGVGYRHVGWKNKKVSLDEQENSPALIEKRKKREASIEKRRKESLQVGSEEDKWLQLRSQEKERMNQ